MTVTTRIAAHAATAEKLITCRACWHGNQTRHDFIRLDYRL